MLRHIIVAYCSCLHATTVGIPIALMYGESELLQPRWQHPSINYATPFEKLVVSLPLCLCTKPSSKLLPGAESGGIDEKQSTAKIRKLRVTPHLLLRAGSREANMISPVAFLLSSPPPRPNRAVLPRLSPLALSASRCDHRSLSYQRRPHHIRNSYLRLSLSEDSSSSSSRGAGKESWPKPTLEEELDAIDDVYMERSPTQGRDKVKVFGAWLDADVAGRKAGKGNKAANIIARAGRGEQLTDDEKAEVFYEEAIVDMRKGKYDTSYAMLERAVKLAGADSRRGGEFKLWAAQALQGVGRNKQAIEVLKSMKTHRDSDVRKVSSELLYIAQAPVLQLNEKDFVAFPDVSHIKEDFDKSKWKVDQTRLVFQDVQTAPKISMYPPDNEQNYMSTFSPHSASPYDADRIDQEQELSKPSIAPYKSKKTLREESGEIYIGSDTGQKPGNDPMMFVVCAGAIFALSYVFLV